MPNKININTEFIKKLVDYIDNKKTDKLSLIIKNARSGHC